MFFISFYIPESPFFDFGSPAGKERTFDLGFTEGGCFDWHFFLFPAWSFVTLSIEMEIARERSEACLVG